MSQTKLKSRPRSTKVGLCLTALQICLWEFKIYIKGPGDNNSLLIEANAKIVKLITNTYESVVQVIY